MCIAIVYCDKNDDKTEDNTTANANTDNTSGENNTTAKADENKEDGTTFAPNTPQEDNDITVKFTENKIQKTVYTLYGYTYELEFNYDESQIILPEATEVEK